MPNLPHLEAQLNQRNGHRPTLHTLEEPKSAADSVTHSDQASLLQFEKQAESSEGDWSSLTQDLIDALPQVWTRGLLYLMVGFVGIILPWALIAKVDQTGISKGRLEPHGQTYRIDASVSGKVTAIEVKEGSVVKAGQTLVSLESDLVKTDLQQAQAKLEGQLNRLTQLEQIKNQLVIATRTQQLQNQAQTAEQQTQINQAEQHLHSGQRDYKLLEQRLAKDLKEVERYHQLWKSGAVPEVKVTEMERTANESQRLLEQAQASIEQAQSEWVRQQHTSERLTHTGELAILDSQKQTEQLQSQIADLQAEIAQTKTLITSLELQFQQRTITSPVNGTVFHLPIQQPGAVVQSGQMVSQIAPQGVPLIFRAQMSSSESGFLQLGMPVKLKFDAYPFQDYGVVPGHLAKIAPDSEKTQTAQGDVETFELEIALDQTYIQAENKRITLTPGQTATAEVIVRQRRIIDFVINPFKKLQKGEFQL